MKLLKGSQEPPDPRLHFENRRLRDSLTVTEHVVQSPQWINGGTEARTREIYPEHTRVGIELGLPAEFCMFLPSFLSEPLFLQERVRGLLRSRNPHESQKCLRESSRDL